MKKLQNTKPSTKENIIISVLQGAKKVLKQIHNFSLAAGPKDTTVHADAAVISCKRFFI